MCLPFCHCHCLCLGAVLLVCCSSFGLVGTHFTWLNLCMNKIYLFSEGNIAFLFLYFQTRIWKGLCWQSALEVGWSYLDLNLKTGCQANEGKDRAILEFLDVWGKGKHYLHPVLDKSEYPCSVKVLLWDRDAELGGCYKPCVRNELFTRAFLSPCSSEFIFLT